MHRLNHHPPRNHSFLGDALAFALAASLIAPALLACSSDPGDDPEPDVIPEPGPAIVASVTGGGFAPYPDYDGIYGRAQIARALDGSTTVDIHIEGLNPGLDYPAHVHALPCGVNQAGGHYKVNPALTEVNEANEIWPSVTTGDDGIGRRTITVDHAARMDAQSVVVHDLEAGGAKMACADLRIPYDGDLVRSGQLAPFADAEAQDQTIAGTAEMTTNAQGTTFTMSVQGLDSGSEYRSHIHAYPCDVIDAGGHYKLDPTIDITDEANELWPEVVPDASGTAQADFTDPHTSRADAQSVVIHRVFPDATVPKVACADLTPAPAVQYRTQGTDNILPAGAERYPDLATTSAIIRRLDGSTVAELAASGLEPGQEYGVHVHTQSCSTDNGGGHYKIDDTIADTVEANEIWLDFVSDDSGAAVRKVLVEHLARPEAQSMVIHDYEDNERLVCIDFE